MPPTVLDEVGVPRRRRPPRVKPSPLLGQHNAEVLGGWLGIGAAEVGHRRAEGIV
jgi:crotonobetainyl-CoA:carnitine CoA-transferase CaiB-like acyl-CoA transferase